MKMLGPAVQTLAKMNLGFDKSSYYAPLLDVNSEKGEEEGGRSTSSRFDLNLKLGHFELCGEGNDVIHFVLLF